MEKNSAYEAPTLELVGEVNEVILGAAWVGDDVDSHYIPVNQEWADD